MHSLLLRLKTMRKRQGRCGESKQSLSVQSNGSQSGSSHKRDDRCQGTTATYRLNEAEAGRERWT